MVVILGGGRGTRLYPLTRVRSKPAVPIAGKYRLIDIPVSNSINSGLKKIFILTQFNSASLNSHISQTYHFDSFSRGFVEILAAEQTQQSGDWYQGTADAVRKHLHRLNVSGIRRVLILGGDHIYRMDYRRVLEAHDQTGAAITVCTLPVESKQASSFGILKIREDGRIVEFKEKPDKPEDIAHLRCSPRMLSALGVEDSARCLLASMGIYVFDLDVLVELLSNEAYIDFGQNVLPASLDRFAVHAWVFDDYWEDIGTIRAFYEANIDLGRQSPKFHFYREDAPIYTHQRHLPGSKLYDCRVHDSIVTEGCLIRDSVIENSIVGIRSRINRGSRICNSVIMGADYYEPHQLYLKQNTSGIPPLGIGENVTIFNAIVDKNARIGDGTVIKNEAGIDHADGDWYYIRDGIVVIPKNTVIPPGSVI